MPNQIRINPNPVQPKIHWPAFIFGVIITAVVFGGGVYAWQNLLGDDTKQQAGPNIQQISSLPVNQSRTYRLPEVIYLSQFLKTITHIAPQEMQSSVQPKSIDDAFLAIEDVLPGFDDPYPLKGTMEKGDYAAYELPKGYAIKVKLKENGQKYADKYNVEYYHADQEVLLYNNYFVSDSGKVIFYGSEISTVTSMGDPNENTFGGYGQYWDKDLLRNLNETELAFSLSNPVLGVDILSNEWGDNFCKEKFGSDWFWVSQTNGFRNVRYYKGDKYDKDVWLATKGHTFNCSIIYKAYLNSGNKSRDIDILAATFEFNDDMNYINFMSELRKSCFDELPLLCAQDMSKNYLMADTF